MQNKGTAIYRRGNLKKVKTIFGHENSVKVSGVLCGEILGMDTALNLKGD